MDPRIFRKHFQPNGKQRSGLQKWKQRLGKAGISEEQKARNALLRNWLISTWNKVNPNIFGNVKLNFSGGKEHLKDYYLCYITPSVISELKEQLLKEETPRKTLRSQSTANRYLAALSGAFNIAVREWNWLKENPVSKISRYKEGKPRDRFLTKEEIEKLLAICKKSRSPHLYAVTLFAVCSGARKGEILGLKWKDLDFARNTATFRDTKNGETRTIPLTPVLSNCLLDEKKKRIILSEYVFPSGDGKQPADIRGAWENAIEEAES